MQHVCIGSFGVLLTRVATYPQNTASTSELQHGLGPTNASICIIEMKDGDPR